MSSAPANADRDLDNLIFNEKKDAAAAGNEAAVTQQQQPQGDDSDGDEKKPAARTSIANVLPVDKLKNGASAAAGCVSYAAAIGDDCEREKEGADNDAL